MAELVPAVRASSPLPRQQDSNRDHPSVRLAAFFWIQSMVRDDARRRLLFELGSTLQHFERALPEDPALTQLTGVYFNLLRMWTDT